MKIGLNDIWDFLEFAAKSKTSWHFSLSAGDISIKNLKYKSLASLKNDKYFDQELINSLFVYREILWQPNVDGSLAASLTPLRVFQAFCEEVCESDQIHPICRELLKGLILHTKRAIVKLTGSNGNNNGANQEIPPQIRNINSAKIMKILGEFRKGCFPIIIFFIKHPLNREDYQKDAWNRLNYCVKIQLTQYNNKFTELNYPYWDILFEQPILETDKS